MKLLARVVQIFKAFWAQDPDVPPYPLTYEEWKSIQQDSREEEIKKALDEELAQVPQVKRAEE
jgi:hypothetical protein